MYRLILNTKILTNYKKLTQKQKEYIKTLMDLTKIKLDGNQIEMASVKHSPSLYISYSLDLFKFYNNYVYNIDIKKFILDLYYTAGFKISDIFLQSEDKESISISCLFISVYDYKGKMRKVFIPCSFLIKQNQYSLLKDSAESRNLRNPIHIPKSILYRYNVHTTNVIFTNELTSKTRLNFLQDKNYMINAHKQDDYPTTLSKNNYVINPNIYREFMGEANLMPLEHLLELFNVDRERLRKSLVNISYISSKVHILGVGGTMGNFLYWLRQLKEYFDLPYIFKKLYLFDNDQVEYHNIFRMPILLPRQSKFKDRILAIPKISLGLNEARNIALNIDWSSQYFNKWNIEKVKGKDIFIGTPDIESRVMIEKLNVKFYCPTHQDNKVRIVETPIIEGGLYYESYGSVDLNRFLLNMFNMTINLIYTLADNHKEPLEKNKLHFEQSFDEIPFVENSKKSKILKNIAYAIN